jgi:hypothetical protein
VQDFVAYNSRGRLAFLLLIAAGFVILGLWFAGVFGPLQFKRGYSADQAVLIGWLCVVIFGLGGIAILGRMLRSGDELRIGPQGICYSSWSDVTIPWSEISRVSIRKFKRTRSIVLHLRNPNRYPSKGRTRVLAALNGMFAGGHIHLNLSGTDRSYTETLSAIEGYKPVD